MDGIGTRPRLRASDAEWTRHHRSQPSARDRGIGRARRLADRAATGCGRRMASQPVAVGHRVVHGGPDYSRAGPDRSRRARPSRALRFARAAASAEQSRADPRAARALPATCRRSPASTPPFIAATARSRITMRFRSASMREGVRRYGFHGLSYEYIASRLPRGRARDCAGPRDRRASRQRRLDVRAFRRPQRRKHDGLHRARRPADGDAAGPARSRRRALSASAKRE